MKILATYCLPKFDPRLVRPRTLASLIQPRYCDISGFFDDQVLKELDRKVDGSYTFVKQIMSGKQWNCDDFEVETVVNARGEYVGDPEFGRYLIREGIEAELIDPQHTVCSVGFCSTDNKWAGWSHRALAKFGIGDRVFEEAYGDDNTLFTQHGSVVIENLAQARQAACNFAAYVS